MVKFAIPALVRTRFVMSSCPIYMHGPARVIGNGFHAFVLY